MVLEKLSYAAKLTVVVFSLFLLTLLVVVGAELHEGIMIDIMVFLLLILVVLTPVLAVKGVMSKKYIAKMAGQPSNRSDFKKRIIDLLDDQRKELDSIKSKLSDLEKNC